MEFFSPPLPSTGESNDRTGALLLMVNHGILNGEGRPSNETGCPPWSRNAPLMNGQTIGDAGSDDPTVA